MDDRKKQVISDICPFYKEYGSCDRCNTELDIDDPPCYFECMANAIINNDYRKQSEGHWIENEDDFWVMCSECGTEFLDDQIGIVNTYKFCPNCGARMKGGAER